MTTAPEDYDPIAACAEQVLKGDPDRFLAAMSGTVEERKRLFPLYAFNLEVARAPYMSQEPMVALIRLQFWRDVVMGAVDGTEAPRHDVATPLSQLVIWGDMRADPLLRIIEAREGDVQGDQPQGVDQVRAYLRATSGALMLAGGQLCGMMEFAGDFEVDTALEDLGEAVGVANWLLAQPALAKAGRGHVAPDAETIQLLCAHGLELLCNARTVLGHQGNPALRSAWRAQGILKQASKQPALVAEGALGGAEVTRRGRMLWLGLTGRW
ncbi:squalene/phytoene synthase family protein [Aliiroseovarius sp. S1123]|jgi:phytoene/squalene synthetase|uniref:squalene/phytoene synthase family protein n=1 Tax=unclassified Aliiroseovarius TaxID=2623558 RepID=UPI001FF2DCE2|nr:squalene/phytoene synthase family protein [Aliiroseovarius sp. S1123]MCK0170460.1 squalene/phytoene synthase family protein [Aliiroseovarius sp. S1123]